MPDANLAHLEPVVLGLGQHLRIHKELLRLNLDQVEHLSAKQLEGAIDIAHLYPEHDPYNKVKHPRDYKPGQRIEAVYAKSAHYVDVSNQRDQPRNLAYVELIVGVSEEKQFVFAVAESGLERLSVAEVRLMMKYAYSRVLARKPIRDRSRVIDRAVVYDYDLPISQRKRAKSLCHARRSGFYILLLVERRKHGGNAVEGLGGHLRKTPPAREPWQEQPKG